MLLSYPIIRESQFLPFILFGLRMTNAIEYSVKMRDSVTYLYIQSIVRKWKVNDSTVNRLKLDALCHFSIRHPAESQALWKNGLGLLAVN